MRGLRTRLTEDEVTGKLDVCPDGAHLSDLADDDEADLALPRRSKQNKIEQCQTTQTPN